MVLLGHFRTVRDQNETTHLSYGQINGFVMKLLHLLCVVFDSDFTSWVVWTERFGETAVLP